MVSDVIISSFVMNFLNQKPSFAASEAATYFAFILESTMMGCLKVFQLTASPLHMNTYLDVDFISSGFDMKSESV